jgi:hypothetical protein
MALFWHGSALRQRHVHVLRKIARGRATYTDKEALAVDALLGQLYARELLDKDAVGYGLKAHEALDATYEAHFVVSVLKQPKIGADQTIPDGTGVSAARGLGKATIPNG